MYTKDGPTICCVAAMSRNRRALGKKDKLLWHIPDDLRRFKELTLGHPIIMGRKTHESILGYIGKPLPDRETIVVSRQEQQISDVRWCSSIEAAFDEAIKIDQKIVHIGGGSELYTQTLPYIDRLYITYVDDEPEADTFFPAFEDEFTIVTEHPPQTHKTLTYQWVDYVRSQNSLK